MEVGGGAGGCSFITVVTMEELESERLTKGEGGSLGGVTSREGEVEDEKEEGGGSSNLSLSLNIKLSPGSAQNDKNVFYNHKLMKTNPIVFIIIEQTDK